MFVKRTQSSQIGIVLLMKTLSPIRHVHIVYFHHLANTDVIGILRSIIKSNVVKGTTDLQRPAPLATHCNALHGGLKTIASRL